MEAELSAEAQIEALKAQVRLKPAVAFSWAYQTADHL
jgi:hypothetical protein